MREADTKVDTTDAASQAAEATGETERSLVRFEPKAELEHRRGRGYVLVVDRDATQADVTAIALEKIGYNPHIASRPEDALEFVTRYPYRLVLTELELNGMTGLDFLRRVHEINPFIAVAVLTGVRSVERVVEAMKAGAIDYLTKPIEESGDDPLGRFKRRVGEAMESQLLVRTGDGKMTSVTRDTDAFNDIVQVSEKMRRVIELCKQVAPTDATVLITGESGTGKEMVAKAIHGASLRRNQRFVPINCAALSPQIIESELFGHEKGSFTGAAVTRKGFFEHSDGGTIFLDEVGDIPLDTQVKLLRVLENREIIRVGSDDPLPVDVRVLSATHRRLEELVEQGKFREDLYYRLKVVTVPLPPLRERPQDIPPLAEMFYKQYTELYNRSFTNIQRDVFFALMTHRWKGNVRELKHTIENLVVTAPGREIRYEDLPESIRQSSSESGLTDTSITGLVGMSIKDVEKELIRNTLLRVDGNRHEAAQMLGIGERTLYRKIKAYGLS